MLQILLEQLGKIFWTVQVLGRSFHGLFRRFLRKLSGDSRYHYERLKNNEIRLLELFPGAEGEPVSCHLHKWQIDKCPLFEALSYAWGDEPRTETIRVEDWDLAITPNPYAALKELRRDFRDSQQSLPDDPGIRLALLLDRLKPISQQKYPPAFSGEGLKLISNCIGEGIGEYIVFCSSQSGGFQSPNDGESRDAYISRFLDTGKANWQEFNITVLRDRVERIQEIWDKYITEEGKARLLRLPRLL
jgi:hypothetical protein